MSLSHVALWKGLGCSGSFAKVGYKASCARALCMLFACIRPSLTIFGDSQPVHVLAWYVLEALKGLPCQAVGPTSTLGVGSCLVGVKRPWTAPPELSTIVPRCVTLYKMSAWPLSGP